MTDNFSVSHDHLGGVENSMEEKTNTEQRKTSSTLETTSSGITNDSLAGISNSGNLKYLVSEHEDEGEELEEERTRISSTIPTTDQNLAYEQNKNQTGVAPAEIPIDSTYHNQSNALNSVASGEESEYSYDYEDDDECHISGFLISDPDPNDELTAAKSTVKSAAEIPQDVFGESDCAITDDTKKSCLTAKLTSAPIYKSSTSCSTSITLNNNLDKATVKETQTESDFHLQKRPWKEPSQAAVSMSLRAEREKTGGKRRLASDLYKIMMNDTEDAGFSLEPASEDSMEKWKIKLFKFDSDSYLHKDLMALGLTHVELEMSFPEQYPFEPPFVRVVRPRFKRQTGFVMNGAICSELLTNEGWNPVNDIESVIVSIRSLLVVGNGRLAAAVDLPDNKCKRGEDDVDLNEEENDEEKGDEKMSSNKTNQEQKSSTKDMKRKYSASSQKSKKARVTAKVGQYSAAEARAAYTHLSDYHKKKGWDSSGWWARKG